MQFSRYIRWIFTLLAISWIGQIYGQEPKFRHFNVKDGLPSATVYHVFQDCRDFIWFSTEAGLSRFDGIHFKTYSMDDGLPDNEIFGVYEDSKNRLWVRAINGKIAYILDGIVYSSENDPSLKSVPQKEWIEQIYEDSEGDIYFAYKTNGVAIYRGDSIIQIPRKVFLEEWENYSNRRIVRSEYVRFPKNNEIVVAGFREDDEHKLFIITNVGEYLVEGDNIKFLRQYSVDIYNTSQIDHELFLGQSFGSTASYQYDEKRKDFRLMVSDALLGTNAKLIPSDLNEEGELWIATLGAGLYLIKDYDTEPSVKEHYLKGKSISYTITDKEGNHWATTLGEGVYMLSPNTVLTYTKRDGLSSNDLYAIAGDKKGNIIVGTVDGKLNIIDKKSNIRQYITPQTGRTYNRINAIAVDSKNGVWTGSDYGVSLLGEDLKHNTPNIKALAIDDKDNVYLGARESLVIVSPEGEIKLLWKERTVALLPLNNGQIWIGANNGLWFFDGKNARYKGTDEPQFKFRIADLAQTKDSVLCVCTGGNGVLLKEGKEIIKVDTDNGLASNVCRDISIDEKNSIWVATNGGITKFRYNRETKEIEDVISYTESDNLSSNDVRGVYASEGKIWAATSEGLSYFEEGGNSALKTPIPPNVYITGVKIWERDTTVHPKYVLSYTQNNFKIEYTGLSFKSGKQIRYKYRMNGGKWITTSNTQAIFPALESGKHKFEVIAGSIDGAWSEEPASIQFNIWPPWWERFWIRLTGFALLMGSIGWFSYFIIKTNKDKNELKSQIAESEQMALRAQMNPHFVFNALNSIQHFIIMEDEMAANHYLSQFSKLMRRVLENSRKSLITLSEEVETLSIYLELEALRFDDKFEYTFEVDELLNINEIKMPSMVVQPFIENAIWHGLMPKKSDRRLHIEFVQKENYLECTVRDNGVGRKLARELKAKNIAQYESTGISNTKKRLQLLSKSSQQKDFVQIDDLMENGEPSGTLVTIRIPMF